MKTRKITLPRRRCRGNLGTGGECGLGYLPKGPTRGARSQRHCRSLRTSSRMESRKRDLNCLHVPRPGRHHVNRHGPSTHTYSRYQNLDVHG